MLELYSLKEMVFWAEEDFKVAATYKVRESLISAEY